MNRMRWLILLIAVNFCFTGQRMSREKAAISPRAAALVKQCSICDEDSVQYISYCIPGCPAVICQKCARGEYTYANLMYDLNRELYFVSLKCNICSMRSRLYENSVYNNSETGICNILRERAKTEQHTAVYQ